MEPVPPRQPGLSAAKRALLDLWEQGEAFSRRSPLALGRRSGTGPAPLSSAQRRLWIFAQLTPGNPAYNVHALARLTGRLDRRALARACAEVVRRHETLRT